MKRLLKSVVVVGIGLLAGCMGRTDDEAWPEVQLEAKPWTRWWWMGSDIDSANLVYNLEALGQAGIGGVEITPIYGVKGRETFSVPYLSPRWMELLAFTQSEARRLGMAMDMNNGTGWPFGGPEVTLEDAASKALFQQYNLKGGETLRTPIRVEDGRQKDMAHLTKLMGYPVAEGGTLDLTAQVGTDGVLNWQAPAGKGYTLTALFTGKTMQQVKRAAPGGEGYVLDHLNKEAVLRYFGKFDRAFESSRTPYPHSFFNDSYEVYGADWTPSLLEEFEKRRGYKLENYFPELLGKGATDSSARVVADYRETVGDILRENFTEVWTEWAHAHGATNRNQAHGSPANLIDLYAMVDIPECESFGITAFDIPGLRKDSLQRPNDSDPTILKYASSAAHVSGKTFTSSETFTWLTEHFRTSLSQCKPELDLMFASGVNHVFFHGSTYSPREAAWPGWKFYASIDMSPTNSIWRDAPAFFTYITRAQSFLQSGKPDNDFLLYLPIYDMWHELGGNYYTTFAIHDMRERLPGFCRAVEEIMDCGFDLDYISDRLLQGVTVEDGFLQAANGVRYKALILPAVKRIPLATLAQIAALQERGATILFAGQYPSDVPGLADLPARRKEFAQLISQLRAAGRMQTTYQSLLEPYKGSSETFVTQYGGKLIRRRHGDGHTYFFTLLQNRPIENQWIALGVNARSGIFYDPMTGQSGKAKLRQQDGRTEVFMQLRPGESLILKTFAGKETSFRAWNYYQPTGRDKDLSTGWEMDFVESEPVVKQSFQLPALVSWTELPNDTLQRNMGTARYRLSFDFHKGKDMEYRLCLGDVRESARLEVNGQKAGILFAPPFEADIAYALQDGKNTVEIEITNLPANRIADYDRRNVEWRIFREINFVNIDYKAARFDTWEPLPSGLLGPVTLKELKKIEP